MHFYEIIAFYYYRCEEDMKIFNCGYKAIYSHNHFKFFIVKKFDIKNLYKNINHSAIE